VIRFLAASGFQGDFNPFNLLSNYITAAGRVRTFISEERFGSWGGNHDEVAPLVGMALASSGDVFAAQLIRQGILRLNQWQPFWWKCYSYVCAQNLKFLLASGGIPDEVRQRELRILNSLPLPSSSLDRAMRFSAANLLGQEMSRDELVDAQEEDGGWPSSFELLVPSQMDGSSGGAQADSHRLMTTALSTLALLRY
jgi:hypothetical protein